MLHRLASSKTRNPGRATALAVVALTVVIILGLTGCQTTDLTELSDEDLTALVARLEEVPDKEAIAQAVEALRIPGGVQVLSLEDASYIVVSLGQRPQEGHSLQIQSLTTADSETIKVVFTELVPGKARQPDRDEIQDVAVYRVEGYSVQAELELTFEGLLKVEEPTRGQELSGRLLQVAGYLVAEEDNVTVNYAIVDGNNLTLAEGTIAPTLGRFEAQVEINAPSTASGLLVLSAQGARRNYHETIPVTFADPESETGDDLTRMSPDQLEALVIRQDVYHHQEVIAAVQEFKAPSEAGDTAKSGVRVLPLEDSVYIIVGLGQRPTSGYSIELGAVEAKDNNTLYVIFQEDLPDEGENVAEVLTYPVEVYRVTDGYQVDAVLFQAYEGGQ